MEKVAGNPIPSCRERAAGINSAVNSLAGDFLRKPESRRVPFEETDLPMFTEDARLLHPFHPSRPPDFFPKDDPSRSFFLPDLIVRSGGEAEKVSPSGNDTYNDTLAKVEAVLFLSREPLSGRRLSQYAELPEGARIRTLVGDLNRRYDVRQCSFRVVEVAGGFQLRTHPKLASWLLRIKEIPAPIRLGVSALETLAVIAYRQPVHRSEIERIRGVQCGELVRQLQERGLAKIVGRSKELGRPFLYGTTKNFLEVFGLGSLRELPLRELFVSTTEDSDENMPTNHALPSPVP